jgi:prefoldin subunit 5
MNIDVNSTAVILSKENASLKEKIKNLQAEIEKLSQEIEKLRESNIALGSRLSTIRRISCYDTEDVD